MGGTAQADGEIDGGGSLIGPYARRPWWHRRRIDRTAAQPQRRHCHSLVVSSLWTCWCCSSTLSSATEVGHIYMFIVHTSMWSCSQHPQAHSATRTSHCDGAIIGGALE